MGRQVTVTEYMVWDLQMQLGDRGGIHINDGEGESPLQVCAAVWIGHFLVKNKPGSPCPVPAQPKLGRNSAKGAPNSILEKQLRGGKYFSKESKNERDTHLLQIQTPAIAQTERGSHPCGKVDTLKHPC